MSSREIVDKRQVPYNEHVAFGEVVTFLVLAGAFCLFIVTALFTIGWQMFRIM